MVHYYAPKSKVSESKQKKFARHRLVAEWEGRLPISSIFYGLCHVVIIASGYRVDASIFNDIYPIEHIPIQAFPNHQKFNDGVTLAVT